MAKPHKIASPKKPTSADHVLDVLQAFGDAEDPLGVAELSRRLRQPTSTVHRALVTLEEAQYLARAEGGSGYRIGLRVHELVQAVFDRFTIRRVSMPFLRRLAALTGETVSLAVRMGWHSVRIAGVEGWQEVHRPLRLGESTPLHASAAGRALLAFLPDADLERYLRGAPLTAFTEATLITPEALWQDIRATRERGFALGLGDLYPDTRSISMPIRDAEQCAVAAVTITGAAGQFSPEADDPRIPQWRAVVAELEPVVRAEPERFHDPYTSRISAVSGPP